MARPIRSAAAEASSAADATGAAAQAPEAAGTQTRALLRAIIVILVVAAALWLLYALEGVLLLLVFAVFFAYLISPLVELVRRPLRFGSKDRHLGLAPAIGIVYLVVGVLVAIAAWILVPQLLHQVTDLARQAPTYVSELRDRLKPWTDVLQPDRMTGSARTAMDAVSGEVLTRAERIISAVALGALSIVGALPWLVLVPVLSFFLLKDAGLLRRGALLSLPEGQLRGRGAQFFHDVNLALAAYIRAQLTACLLIGVVCTIAFVVMGVPYALVLGVLAGLLEFVPLVGPFVLAIAATGAACLVSLPLAGTVLLFLAVLRVVEDYVIYPRLIGHGVHLHPLAVIVAVLAGAELGGVTGIFLSIPVVAVLAVAHRHWLEHRGSEGIVADLLAPPEPTGETAVGTSQARP